MALPKLKFKKHSKYPHKRSEGLTRRGEARQERLQLGSKVCKDPLHGKYPFCSCTKWNPYR